MTRTIRGPGQPRARWWERNPACWSWKIPTRTELERLRTKLPNASDETLRWLLMAEMHRDRCAACGRSCYRSQSLRTDHDHETGLVRGFLCPSCNTSEGYSRSEGGIFGMYRLLNPAMMCGVRQAYWHHWER